jgi:hypothetical protein
MKLGMRKAHKLLEPLEPLKLLGLCTVLFLTGCSQIRFPDRMTPQRGAVFLDDASSGSRHRDFLTWSDRREIDKAAWAATISEVPRTPSTWKNDATGSSGTVRPGTVFLVGFNSGSEIEAPLSLDTSPRLEPTAGDYVTTANTNVRLSPRVRGKKALLLPEGSIIKAVAYEPIERWYLVAKDDRVLGYVYAELVTKTSGGDLLLAGGGKQYAKLCRELTYKMLFSTGTKDEWLNGACKEGSKTWKIVGGRALQAAG